MDDDQLELELSREPRDWRAHPGAKVGAWSVEVPLDQLLHLGTEDDEAQLATTLLESLRQAFAGPYGRAKRDDADF